MSQHDYVVANGTGGVVRADLNDALAAIVSNNAGTSAPGTTYAHMWWTDTTTGKLKRRNAANSAWIEVLPDLSANYGGLAAVSAVNTFTAQQRWAKGADIASATTLVLGTDGNYFDVTGTTTITGITVAAGTPFMLQFDGALTLTHHATNLNLPGSTNITTAAGDRAICFAEAADQVRVLEYVQAAVGTWTPAFTFATPGNLSIAYTHQIGRYLRIGSLIVAWFSIQTSTFTHTSASGAASITGLPATCLNVAGLISYQAMGWSGITKTNYTQVMPQVSANSATISLIASGSGQAITTVNAADMPTGGSVTLRGIVVYPVA